MKLEPIDFEQVLGGISKQLAYMAGARPVDVRISVSGDPGFVSDAYRLQMVLNNLVSNAIRYQDKAEEQPYVSISVQTCAARAAITIADNGIGIDEANHKRIFDMFYRVSDQSKGSGLGLYIVKETIDVLRGTIRMQSEPGIGTTFYLDIPNRAEHSVAALV